MLRRLTHLKVSSTHSFQSCRYLYGRSVLSSKSLTQCQTRTLGSGLRSACLRNFFQNLLTHGPHQTLACVPVLGSTSTHSCCTTASSTTTATTTMHLNHHNRQPQANNKTTPAGTMRTTAGTAPAPCHHQQQRRHSSS